LNCCRQLSFEIIAAVIREVFEQMKPVIDLMDIAPGLCPTFPGIPNDENRKRSLKN